MGIADVFWVHKITPSCPVLTLKLDGQAFTGLLDSGADATVIFSKHWPSSWPLTVSTTHMQGIGHSNIPQMSDKTLTRTDQEGNRGLSTVLSSGTSLLTFGAKIFFLK